MTFIHRERDTRRGRRALVAGAVGNLIEWYQFGVYGYFSTIIAARFFTPEAAARPRLW